MNLVYQTRGAWRIGVIGMMALVGYACTDDERNPVETTAVPPTAAALAAGETDGYDLNFDNAPTPESSQTVNITSSPLAGIGGVTTLGEWEFPSPYKVGTGLINPFMRVQANGMEQGFNTDNGTPLDTKSGTRSLPLNYVPVLVDPESPSTTVRQFIFDANENNNQAGDWRISIDQFDVYVCGAGGDQIADRGGLSACVQVYNIDGSGENIGPLGTPFAVNHVFSAGSGFATDALTSGSGKTLDYDILIQNASFDAALEQLAGPDAAAIAAAEAACQYNGVDATPCGYWVVVDVIMGDYNGGQADTGGFNWTTDATFEEFSTIIQPWVEVSKTATPSYTRTYDWMIQKTVAPASHTLFEGQSGQSDYTVTVTPNGSTDSDWAVSGAVTVVNPSDQDVMIESITDVLTPGDIPVALDCGGTAPYMLASGGTLECTYTKDDFTQQQIDAAADGFVNNVQVQLDGLAAYFAVAPFNFDVDPTSEVYEVVNITDYFDDSVLTELGTATWNMAGTATVFNYSKTFTCDEDDGSHPNVATIEETGDNDDASVTVNCLDLNVTKTAVESNSRTYNWMIDKTVDPDSWDLFVGDDATSDYVVTVDLQEGNEFTDFGFMVDGVITVTNPNTLPVFIQGVSDMVSPDIAATVDCAVTFPYELAGNNATLECDYSASLPDDADRTNTATVTAKPTEAGTSKDFTGTEDVDFEGVVPTIGQGTVEVRDTYDSGDFPASVSYDDELPATFDYSRTFSCSETGSTDYDNTASLWFGEDKYDEASASVTVDCYDLDVTKDADTEWTRTWDWTIEKTLDATQFLDGTFIPGDLTSPGTATIQQGQSLAVTWDIDIDATSTDHMFMVDGSIYVDNSSPIDAVINSVADVITAGDIDGMPECSVTFPYTLVAGDMLTCSYGVELDNATDRLNTATAAQQNYSYASDGTPTDNGTTDYSGTADIEFAATPTYEIDECVAVTDLLTDVDAAAAAGSEDLGNYCASDGLPKNFEVTFTFGPNQGEIPVECGDNMFDNEGKIVTNDTPTESTDNEGINIYVDCLEGCTLTQGYWKTHSLYHNNGKQYDDRWENIGDLGENELFFNSNMTWIEVFWTAPKGDAWYNLAHQYMAAKLNILAGADPSAVSQAMSDAEQLFQSTNPGQIQRGRNGRDLRQQFTGLAGTLGSYNEGLIGPGHCTEEQLDDLLGR